MDRQRQQHNMNTLTFANIPLRIQQEMAKYLDTHGDASWKALAEHFHMEPLNIHVNGFLLFYGHCYCFRYSLVGVLLMSIDRVVFRISKVKVT